MIEPNFTFTGSIECVSRMVPTSSVLDGTGKGFLVDQLRAELPSKFKVDGYDPSVEKWSNPQQVAII